MSDHETRERRQRRMKYEREHRHNRADCHYGRRSVGRFSGRQGETEARQDRSEAATVHE